MASFASSSGEGVSHTPSVHSAPSGQSSVFAHLGGDSQLPFKHSSASSHCDDSVQLAPQARFTEAFTAIQQNFSLRKNFAKIKSLVAKTANSSQAAEQFASSRQALTTASPASKRSPTRSTSRNNLSRPL